MPASGARIFLAAPIPNEAGVKLLDWAAKHLPKDDCRLTKLSQMHVTLFFSPKTSPRGIERLKTLTQRLEWRPLSVETRRVELLSRDACSVMLKDISPPETNLPARFNWRTDDGHFRPISESLLDLDEAFTAEIPGRYYRRRNTLRLHATLARIRGLDKSAMENVEPPPSLTFNLTDAVLYNSILKPDGAHYVELARAVRK